MVKCKYKKLLLIIFIIILSFLSIMSVVMSEDILHKEQCNIPDCKICNLINISKSIMKDLLLVNSNIFIVMIIIPIIQLVGKDLKRERTLTLVEAKVVQNK